MPKATGLKLTPEYLAHRAKALTDNEWPVSKWILFGQALLAQGFTIHLYEARRTPSKYLTISKLVSGRRSVKVRFSNHKPILARELKGDCDYFVGVTNLGVTSSDTTMAWVKKHFE